MFRTAARLAAASALVLAVAAPSASAAGGMHVAAGDLNEPVATAVELKDIMISSAQPKPSYLKVKMTDVLISSAR